MLISHPIDELLTRRHAAKGAKIKTEKSVSRFERFARRRGESRRRRSLAIDVAPTVRFDAFHSRRRTARDRARVVNRRRRSRARASLCRLNLNALEIPPVADIRREHIFLDQFLPPTSSAHAERIIFAIRRHHAPRIARHGSRRCARVVVVSLFSKISKNFKTSSSSRRQCVVTARVPLVSGIVSRHMKSSFFVFFRVRPSLDVASRLTPRGFPSRAPTPFARRPLAAFTPVFAPLDCAAPPRLVRSTKGLFPTPFPRVRAVAATRRDRRTGDMARANSALARFEFLPTTSLSTSLDVSRATSRATSLTETREKNSLASLNPLAGRRADRARACAATNPRRPRTNGWVPLVRLMHECIRFDSIRCDPSSPRDDARGERRTAIDAKEIHRRFSRARERDGDSATTESVTNR